MAIHVSEKVLSFIEQQIKAGHYHNGTILPAEREMAAQLEVGRQAVREAYRMLQAYGIATVKRGKDGGTIIRGDKGAALSKIFEMQLALDGAGRDEVAEIRIGFERALVALAAREQGSNPAFISELTSYVSAMDNVPTVGAFNEQDTLFHLCIAYASNNQLMADMYAAIRKSVSYPIKIASEQLPDYKDFQVKLNAQHLAIVQAIANQDGAKAADLAEEHIRFAYSILPIKHAIGRYKEHMQ